MNTVPEKVKSDIKRLNNSDDQIAKIFYVNVGPEIMDYKSLGKASETQKWYLMSNIDKYISSLPDRKAEYVMGVLMKKYSFPESVMNNFPRYNPSVMLGWNCNTYGLDKSKLDVIVVKKIDKALTQRETFMQAISSKGIQIRPSKVSIDKMVKDLDAMMDSETKAEIEKLYNESEGKPDPKAVLGLIARKQIK